MTRSTVTIIENKLGTFGLTKGTILAQEAEVLYSGETDPEAAPQLTDIARRMKGLVAGRP